ncbi:MAG: DNA primase catalytic subunit PriS [Candidatus Micrarchaeota archaeon]
MEEKFVREKFSRYYARAYPSGPPSVQSREWGFGGWDKKIESRHAHFNSGEELVAYLRRNAPLYISYSSAYYEYPDARPMEKKNWLGADLIFDIDADQLNPPCIEKHGKGWVCDTCLGMAKHETHRLVEEFLLGEFGFSRMNLSINFSGNRGYHIHVFDDEVKRLTSQQRREITDYITGKGLEGRYFFFEKSGRWEGPKKNDPGWGGRLARGFIGMIKDRKLERILKPTTAKRFYKGEKEVIAGVERGNWDVVGLGSSHKNYEDTWEKLGVELGVKLGDNIDQNVTFDTSKLIRMPESLHGETGLVAKKTDNLEKFDPLKDAVVFGKEPVKVKVEKAPEIRIWDETFGPYEKFEGELPEAVAVYLICKRRAKLG